MAGSARLEERLAQIKALEGEGPLAEDQVCLVRDALSGTNSLLVAAAARVIRKRQVPALAPDLVRAFSDLLARSAKSDKGCLAKAAVAEALNAIDCREPEPFLRGVRYTQPEPAYGRTVDTAARVRAECAIGLARISHPQAAREILPLLVDPEPEARAGGVRALAYLGGDAGDLLLRFKALVGDEHPAVVGECLSGLVKMDPAGSAEFVAKFMESPDLSVVEEAAMALASWQDPLAAQILCRCRVSRTDNAFRERLLVPIAMTRCDEAIDALEAVILDEPQDSALGALTAAAMHRHDPRWRDRIAKAVTDRADPAVSRAFEKEFGVELTGNPDDKEQGA